MAESVITTQLEKLADRITSLEAMNNNLELEKRVAILEVFQEQFHTLKTDINLKVDTFTARLEVLETDIDALKTRLQLLETNQTTINLQMLETNQTTTNLQQRFDNFEDEMESRFVTLEKQFSDIGEWFVRLQKQFSDIGELSPRIDALEKKMEALEKGVGNRPGSNVNQSKERLRKQKEEVVQHVEKIEERAQTDTNVLLIAVAFFLGFNSTICYNSVVSAFFQGVIRIVGIIWFVGITYFKVDQESRKFGLMMKKHADLVLKANKVDEDEKKVEARLRAREDELSGSPSRVDSYVGDSVIGIEDPCVPLIGSDETGRHFDGTNGLSGDSFSLEVTEALPPYKFWCRHMFTTVLTGIFGIMITVIMLSGRCKSS